MFLRVLFHLSRENPFRIYMQRMKVTYFILFCFIFSNLKRAFKAKSFLQIIFLRMTFTGRSVVLKLDELKAFPVSSNFFLCLLNHDLHSDKFSDYCAKRFRMRILIPFRNCSWQIFQACRWFLEFPRVLTRVEQPLAVRQLHHLFLDGGLLAVAFPGCNKSKGTLLYPSEVTRIICLCLQKHCNFWNC